MLTFQDGKLILKEGKDVWYEVEYVYELERYIYVKQGQTLFYPTAQNVQNVSKKRPFRESICYLTPVYHDSEIHDCKDEDGIPTGDCPIGTITVRQRHYYGPAQVSWKLAGLKPNTQFKGHIHWNGDWDLEKLYFGADLEGEVMDPELAEPGQRYGDLTNFKADEYGEYRDVALDPKINLFGQWNVFGRMCDIHKPDGRAVSFGVFGRTGRFDEIPQWDLGPHPCYGYDSSMPHGGYDYERCKVWKEINNHFPDIAKLPGFDESG